MMNPISRSIGSLLAGSVAFVLAAGLTAHARAGFYAFAVEQTSNYTLIGGTVGTFSSLSSSSASQTGNPSGIEGHNAGLDVLQSYVGPGPRPAENTFTPLGQVNADYVRGDSLVTLSPSLTTSNVAEGFLNGPGNSSGSGSWSLSAPLTMTATGNFTLGFSFTNLLTLANAPTVTAPTGSVAADYGYNFSIQDANGSTVFISSPNVVNRSLSLVVPGSISTPGSGSVSIVSGTLAAASYTITLSGSEHVFLNALAPDTAPVPEPGSAALMAIGVAVLTGGAIRNRRFLLSIFVLR